MSFRKRDQRNPRGHNWIWSPRSLRQDGGPDGAQPWQTASKAGYTCRSPVQSRVADPTFPHDGYTSSTARVGADRIKRKIQIRARSDNLFDRHRDILFRIPALPPHAPPRLGYHLFIRMP